MDRIRIRILVGVAEKKGVKPFRRKHEVFMAMFDNHELAEPKMTGNVCRRRITV